MIDGQSASLFWCPAPTGAQGQIFITVSCGFVDVGYPLWREDGSVIYNSCWPSSAESFSGPSPAGLMIIFTLRFENPQTWRARFHIYIPQWQLYPQALGSLFAVSYDSQGDSGNIRTRLHRDGLMTRSVG
jgi:hypothetical protein